MTRSARLLPPVSNTQNMLKYFLSNRNNYILIFRGYDVQQLIATEWWHSKSLYLGDQEYLGQTQSWEYSHFLTLDQEIAAKSGNDLKARFIQAHDSRIALNWCYLSPWRNLASDQITRAVFLKVCYTGTRSSRWFSGVIKACMWRLLLKDSQCVS